MSVAACDMVNPTASKRMKMEDTMPALVRAFVEGGQDAAKLLSEFMRHVARVARPYPDAYFVLSQKNDDAVDDLGNRAFSICASVEKGRFPFSGGRHSRHTSKSTMVAPFATTASTPRFRLRANC